MVRLVDHVGRKAPKRQTILVSATLNEKVCGLLQPQARLFKHRQFIISHVWHGCVEVLRGSSVVEDCVPAPAVLWQHGETSTMKSHTCQAFWCCKDHVPCECCMSGNRVSLPTVQVLEQCQRWCPDPERLFTSVGPQVQSASTSASASSTAQEGSPGWGWDHLKFSGGDSLNPGSFPPRSCLLDFCTRSCAAVWPPGHLLNVWLSGSACCTSLHDTACERPSAEAVESRECALGHTARASACSRGGWRA